MIWIYKLGWGAEFTAIAVFKEEYGSKRKDPNSGISVLDEQWIGCMHVADTNTISPRFICLHWHFEQMQRLIKNSIT